MPTTDLSIAPPSFVEFSYNGWPAEKKDELEIAAREIAGVTAVNQAGARSSIHVHFDPATVARDALILAVDQAADSVLPGYNFAGR